MQVIHRECSLSCAAAAVVALVPSDSHGQYGTSLPIQFAVLAGSAGNWIALTICLIVGYGLWRAFRPQPTFVLRVHEGQLLKVSGQVPAPFHRDLEDIIRQARLDAGSIRGFAHKTITNLEFSREIPADVRQQIRNAWWANV